MSPFHQGWIGFLGPQTEWLKQRTFIIAPFWKLVCNQGGGNGVLPSSPCPNFPFLYGYVLYWIRPHPNDLF